MANCWPMRSEVPICLIHDRSGCAILRRDKLLWSATRLLWDFPLTPFLTHGLRSLQGTAVSFSSSHGLTAPRPILRAFIVGTVFSLRPSYSHPIRRVWVC